MSTAVTRSGARQKRHERIRLRLSGSTIRPRLAVFRSLNQIYAQVIDDSVGHTLASASSLEQGLREEGFIKDNVQLDAQLCFPLYAATRAVTGAYAGLLAWFDGERIRAVVGDRLAQRWGLTSGKSVVQTELDLKRLFPKAAWTRRLFRCSQACNSATDFSPSALTRSSRVRFGARLDMMKSCRSPLANFSNALYRYTGFCSAICRAGSA